MIIDLITLRDSPHEFEYSLAPEEIDLDSDEAELKNAVRVKGKLTKHIAQTDVEGTISAPLEIDCTRCLQKIDKDLEFAFEAAFVTPENFTASREAELNAKDLDVSVIEGNEIDLSELVREQILLNLPEQVFCREDCKGLCDKCGANRNLIDCNCIEKETDPRWAALKNLNKG
ncbi:MAG TPA: DUF177 domain-containing protein [Pyrinomonadaceae bacterium]|nr:DUF177 domain-containing protein [Pyrinomonadaceae bacterium]